ncbi:MAG: 50S ribosomal protein L18 [Acidobacteria bacterium]|jgi:large subunit ribosomal protein L18|nr:MAG: 50S ribosomal protein L18 [Acidobacteriota bacterium]
MAKLLSRNAVRKRIHLRIRKKIRGTSAQPRLNIFRSLRHIFAQIIDDDTGITLVSASSLDKEIRATKSGGSVAGAKLVGAEIAKRAKARGIEQVVYDRGGYGYHGRVKVLADAAREAGLKF